MELYIHFEQIVEYMLNKDLYKILIYSYDKILKSSNIFVISLCTLHCNSSICGNYQEFEISFRNKSLHERLNIFPRESSFRMECKKKRHANMNAINSGNKPLQLQLQTCSSGHDCYHLKLRGLITK